MNHLRFCLNGQWISESAASPTTTLLRYLRDSKSMSGTKEGCAEGDCGACTVAIAEVGADGKAEWRAVNSCLVLLPMLQGKQVVTVEALKSGEQYHPAQEAMAKALGSQCGYCTPGIVMSLFEATYRKDMDAPWKLDDQLCGNLCRCTGYRPIREAAEAVAGTCPKDRFDALKVKPESMELDYSATGQKFFTPSTFDALWSTLDAHPDARFVVGGTDLSLEVTKKFVTIPKLVSLEGLAPLRAISVTPTSVTLGATATIGEVEAATEKLLPSLARMTRYFGARQIKHRGTVGGNICTASPIGDLPPALISLGAIAILKSRAGERRVPLEEFFVSYRKTQLGPKEIFAGVEIPRPAEKALAVCYKVSKRRELDISAVSAGFLVELDGAGKVARARLAFGGMAATPKRAAKAESALVGQPWSAGSVENAAQQIAHDFSPLSDHRGSASYRARVAANLIRGFFEETKSAPQPVLKARHAGTVGVAP